MRERARSGFVPSSCPLNAWPPVHHQSSTPRPPEAACRLVHGLPSIVPLASSTLCSIIVISHLTFLHTDCSTGDLWLCQLSRQCSSSLNYNILLPPERPETGEHDKCTPRDILANRLQAILIKHFHRFWRGTSTTHGIDRNMKQPNAARRTRFQGMYNAR